MAGDLFLAILLWLVGVSLYLSRPFPFAASRGRMALALAAGGLLLCLAACGGGGGGGSSSNNSGNYTVTVTGSDDRLMHTLPLTLTVD
jgi:hypothetical protein